jgi:hypothetical protein
MCHCRLFLSFSAYIRNYLLTYKITEPQGLVFCSIRTRQKEFISEYRKSKLRLLASGSYREVVSQRDARTHLMCDKNAPHPAPSPKTEKRSYSTKQNYVNRKQYMF